MAALLAFVLLGTACEPPSLLSGVDRSEGTLDLSVGSMSTHNYPVVCANHKSFEAYLGSPIAYVVKVQLNPHNTASIDVEEGNYKSGSASYSGMATVTLTSQDGPVGSLKGTAGPLTISASFRCSANGGGVYTGVKNVMNGTGAAIYFTVDHSGSRIVNLMAITEGWPNHPAPNVQLISQDLPVSSDGHFSVSGNLVAGDSTGLAADGKPAHLEGQLDRFGGATGTITFLSDVAPAPISWSARVAGPIPEPVFPHAPMDIRLISTTEVASDPAINLLYPQSTNLDGTAPGMPLAHGERPQDQWSNAEFIGPEGGTPAEAYREQITPGSVYDIAAWYTQKLLAMGWQTATNSNYGNLASVVMVKGSDHLFVLGFPSRPTRLGQRPLSYYQLILRETAQDTVHINGGAQPGPPDSAIVPCLTPQPATIRISGTVTGTTENRCDTLLGHVGGGRVNCQYPTVAFAIEQTVFIVWGPPYTRNGLEVVGPHLEVFNAASVGPPSFTSTNGTVHVTGHYVGSGYDETVDVTTACS